MSETPGRIRLARLLAQRGVAARRKAEELIASGAVTVNGAVAAVVTLVDPEADEIAVNGNPIPGPVRHVYYVLDKPAGYITGRADPRGRPSVLDFCRGLPVRVEPVGRLDYDTWGALLLTNDGELAHRLTHPSRRVPKRYAARVVGVPDPRTLQMLEAGVELPDGRTAPARLKLRGVDASGNARLEITVTEGRNRLVRRMFEAVDHPVLSLRREAFAGITTRGMKRGELRELTPAEVRRLKRIAGLAGPRSHSAE
jgi:23S rRNA pseudouridine2605 synthase